MQNPKTENLSRSKLQKEIVEERKEKKENRKNRKN